MTDLADRIEREGPSRELDAEIARLLGYALRTPDYNKEGPVRNPELRRWYAPDARPCGWLESAVDFPPAFTSDLNAAMALAENAQVGEIMRKALSRLGDRFALHVRPWPDEESYSQWLAKFFAAAAIRARMSDGR